MLTQEKISKREFAKKEKKRTLTFHHFKEQLNL